MKKTLKKISWDRTSEEEILDFCKDMARQMETLVNKPFNGLFGSSFMDQDSHIRKGAKNYLDAYLTVVKYIEKEMKIRKLLK